ncbi:MAG: cation:dicarboxylase symporter family transporter, partial [Bacilli bacterium]
NIFGRVYLIVIPLHLIYICGQFTIAGAYSKTNPIEMIKNQIPGYLTAVGTQSSAATIPVNVECAEKNGVSKQIREFVVPLCATIHLLESIISVISFTVAVLMMNQMDYSIGVILSYLLMLVIAMVGIPSDGWLASLMIALYITQDSFGTAANVSGYNAIAIVIDQVNKKWDILSNIYFKISHFLV